MINLYGMRLLQKNYVIYVTTATVEQITSWKDSDRMRPDIWKREVPDGYQRPPDESRFKKIADYIEGRLKVDETIMPNSIILNLRQEKSVTFTPIEFEKKTSSPNTITFGEIKIPDEALPFFEVDGQHRIRGLMSALNDAKKAGPEILKSIKDYPVPLTIMEGLDRPTEAMQFVVINTTQKKVDPALVLRILHKRWKDKGQKLDFFIKGQSWRLKAIEVCDLLNSDADSPWCDKISPPGIKRKGAIIGEQYFITSLELVYSRMEHEEIKANLDAYWRSISSLWKECMNENVKKYSLQRGVGAVVFHGIFPFIHSIADQSLKAVNVKSFGTILKPIRKTFSPDYWAKGGPAKSASSKGAQANLIHDMLTCLLFKGKKVSMKKLGEIKNKLYKKAKQNKGEKALEAAFKLIPLRNFQPFTAKEVNNIDAGATGGYILYSYNKQKLYVGRSDKADLKDRLMQHIQNKEEDYCLFNYRLCKEPSEAYKLECALYHSIPTEILLNKEHPSSVGAHTCPFC